MYERLINLARIMSAVFVTIGGVGFTISINTGYVTGITFSGLTLAAGLGLFVLLVLEQLLTAWIVTTRGRISIAAFMGLTAAIGAFFATTRWSVGMAIAGLTLVLILVAILVEKNRKPPAERNQKSSAIQDSEL